MPRVSSVLAIAAVLSGVADGGAAQQAMQFAFTPQLGRTVRTLTEIRTTTTLVGFPAVPDGARVESERWVNATQRVAAVEGTAAEVTVVVDSVRGRVRTDGEAWVDRVDATFVGQVARAVVSPRFGIVGLRSSSPLDADVLQGLGAYAAGLGFAFPDEPVPVGSSFETGGRIRARVTTDATTGVTLDEVVVGDLTLTLDSVVGAGSENAVAHLTFRGAFAPRTTETAGEQGDLTLALSGAFAGRLAWSAAWGAFVSGAIRLRVEGRIRAATPLGAQAAQVTWERTIVHQVRP
jgi:hypothetical protein